MVAKRKCKWTRVHVSPLISKLPETDIQVRPGTAQSGRLFNWLGLKWQLRESTQNCAPQKQLGPAAGLLAKMFIIKGDCSGTKTWAHISSQS